MCLTKILSRNQKKQKRVKSPTNGNTDHRYGDSKCNSKTLLILNKNFCRRLTEIKSVWLVISEAGNAVCGVV